MRDNLKRVLDYAENQLKTTNPARYKPEEMRDLAVVLSCAKDGEKTAREQFVTGIRCSDKTAFSQMMMTKERFGKTGGNLAYHAYQSFRPHEVTPEECHRIGVELATRLWGDKFEVLVTTHLNTNCCHNHFVINSVSFLDGRKLNNNYAMYFSKFRKLSDQLCRERALSVIERPNGTTPRSIYFAEQSKEPTHYNLMRQAIDRAVSLSLTTAQFEKVLKRQGYVLDLNPKHKYPTIRSVNSSKATRLYRLGESYLPPAISRRILQNPLRFRPEYGAFLTIKRTRRSPKPLHYRGSFAHKKKITGIQALFLLLLYLLGVRPQGKRRSTPLSPEMREAWRKIDRYSRQVRLLCREHLNSEPEIQAFVQTKSGELVLLTTTRKKCYNRLRRCSDPEDIAEIKTQRDRLTEHIKRCRKDIATAETVLEDIPPIRALIQLERQTQAAIAPPIKERKRDYYER